MVWSSCEMSGKTWRRSSLRSSCWWNSWKPHWPLKRWIHAMVRVCPWHRIPPPGDLKRPGSIRGAKPLRWVWYGHDMVVCWKEKQRNRLRKSRFWLHLEVETVSKNLILFESRTVVEVSITSESPPRAESVWVPQRRGTRRRRCSTALGKCWKCPGAVAVSCHVPCFKSLYSFMLLEQKKPGVSQIPGL